MELKFLEKNADFDEAKVCILPVSYEGTVCFRKGTSYGPKALLYGSREVEEYVPELGCELIGEKFPEGFSVLPQIEGDGKKSEDVILEVKTQTQKILNAEKFPVIIGGEHSISIGSFSAIVEKYPNTSILQIDAHADLRDEFEGDTHSHACAMRRMMERAKSGVQIGVRSLSSECAQYIHTNRNIRSWGKTFEIEEVLNALETNVYLSIDLDGFDPSEVPGVGTPCPGGLSWDTGLELLKEIARHKRIVGFDIVELAPIKGQVVSELFAANLLYKLVTYCLFAKEIED